MSESGKDGQEQRSADVILMMEHLKNIKMYEEGMTREQMFDILKVIKESEEASANQGGQQKVVNKSPEVTRVDNQASNSRGSISRPSNRESMSPELPNSQSSQTRKGASQGKHGDSGEEGVFSPEAGKLLIKENKNVQQANINKNLNTINENSSKAMDNKERANLPQRMNEPAKFKVNPLDVTPNPNDVPLQSRFSAVLKEDSGTWINADKALVRLSNHMQEIAEQHYDQIGNTERFSYPWGKAIQVGTASNGSMDRNFDLHEESADAGPSKEPNSEVDVERLGRRRACTIKTANYASMLYGNDNSDDDFEPVASSSKRKPPTKRADSSERTSFRKKTDVENTKTKKRGNVSNEYDFVDHNAVTEDDDEGETQQREEDKKRAIKRAGSSEKNDQPWESLLDEVDIDEDTETKAKKMKPTESSVATIEEASIRSTREKRVEPASSNALERGDDALAYFNDVDEVTMIYDDNEANRSCGTSQKPRKSVHEEAVSSTSTSYPRRIVPPVPKGRWAGIRARCPLFGFPNLTRQNKKPEQDKEASKKAQGREANVGLADSEIAQALEDNDDVEVMVPMSDVIEIKPLRMKVSSRMKMQSEHLRLLAEQEKQKEIQYAEEKRIREEQIDREKQEKVKQRIQEQKAKVRTEELTAKALDETEKRWNSSLNQQVSRKRHVERTELHPNGPRRNSDVQTIEIQSNDLDVEPDFEEPSGDPHSKRVPCPICCKEFPVEKIEDHAGSCEEFGASSSAGASRSNSPAFGTRPRTPLPRNSSMKFDCAVCSTFSTNDGKIYEDHVNRCLARRATSGTTSTTIEVPDSPVRTFRRISELTDSEIDYHNRFMPKTNSRVNDTRKRKRN